MNRLCSPLSFLTLSFCLLSACGDRHGSKTESQGAKPTQASLRLKWVYDPGFAGEMVGAKLSLFKSHGLDLTIRPGGFEADPLRLVASGADTFGVAGADVFLLAREKGVPIVAFAAGYLQTPVTFYVNAKTGIRSPSDFVRHRIGYQAGQDTATVYEALLRKAGVNRKRIIEVPVKFDFTPFLTRQIDVWPGYAATQSYILKREGVPYTTIVPSAYGLSHLGTVYFASERTIREQPAMVQAFVDGLIEGWQKTYATDSRDAVIKAISEYDSTSLTADLISFNLDKQKEFILPPGRRFCEFDESDWKAIRETLSNLGVLRNKVAIPDAVTFSFLAEHYAKHGTIGK